MTAAVVFDLDGVLIHSEHLWDMARREVSSQHGGRWSDGATSAMQGMSAPEWSRYMRDVVGVRLEAGQVVDEVLERLLAYYRDGLPLLPGAVEAVERISARWPLGLASSANRVVIDTVLEMARLTRSFLVTVSSEEVARGKPAPDVYVEAARRLGHRPVECAAIEDSASGIRSALAAGFKVLAIPNRDFPPPADLLGRCHAVLEGIESLTADRVE